MVYGFDLFEMNLAEDVGCTCQDASLLAAGWRFYGLVIGMPHTRYL